MSKRGRGGSAGNKFRMSLGLPVEAYIFSSWPNSTTKVISSRNNLFQSNLSLLVSGPHRRVIKVRPSPVAATSFRWAVMEIGLEVSEHHGLQTERQRRMYLTGNLRRISNSASSHRAEARISTPFQFPSKNLRTSLKRVRNQSIGMSKFSSGQMVALIRFMESSFLCFAFQDPNFDNGKREMVPLH